MKFILHCVSFCSSSSTTATTTSRSSSSSICSSADAEHPSLNQHRKRGRVTVSRSIPTSDWRPSLGAIYEDEFVKEAEEQKNQLIAESDRTRRMKKKKRSEILNRRSYRFDNDFGRRGLSSINSGFCVTPFMI